MLLLARPGSRSTFFPYTTLFRSVRVFGHLLAHALEVLRHWLEARGCKEVVVLGQVHEHWRRQVRPVGRAEEHTSDSSHLGRSYVVVCLKKNLLPGRRRVQPSGFRLRLCSYWRGRDPDRHSFPTRRSSDLYVYSVTSLPMPLRFCATGSKPAGAKKSSFSARCTSIGAVRFDQSGERKSTRLTPVT